MNDEDLKRISPRDLSHYLPKDLQTKKVDMEGTTKDSIWYSPLSRNEAQERTRAAFRYIIDRQIDGVINAPPSSGKSYGGAKAIAEGQLKAAYFAPRTELYEQMKEWCEDEGLIVKVLPSMPRDCHSYESGTAAYSLYQRGMSPSDIHQEEKACTGDCPYMEKLPTLDREELQKRVPLDQYDVLIGHTNHAYVEPYLRNRTVIFDDISKRAFITEHEVTTQKIRVILEDESFPYDTVEGLYEARASGVEQFVTTSKLGKLNIDPWSDENQTTHADAKRIVETVLNAEKLGNGFSTYSHNSSDNKTEDYIGVTDGEQNAYLLRRPSIQSSNSVILLNAYPILHASEPVWFNWRTGAAAKLVQPLTQEERREYIAETLGIDVIQTTEHIKPYSSGKHVALEKDSKLIEIISENHGISVPVITPNKARLRFEQQDLPIEQYLNYAQIESNNEFGDREVGLVIGSPEWRIHDQTRLIGAFMNQCVEWNGEHGIDKSFGDVGDPIMNSFREAMVGQAILRFGREGQGATVYVHTSAIPEDIPITKKRRDYSSTATQLVEYMLSQDKEVFETSKFYESLIATRQGIRQTLDNTEIFERVEEGKGPKPSKWRVQSSDSDEHLN